MASCDDDSSNFIVDWVFEVTLIDSGQSSSSFRMEELQAILSVNGMVSDSLFLNRVVTVIANSKDSLKLDLKHGLPSRSIGTAFISVSDIIAASEPFVNVTLPVEPIPFSTLQQQQQQHLPIMSIDLHIHVQQAIHNKQLQTSTRTIEALETAFVNESAMMVIGNNSQTNSNFDTSALVTATTTAPALTLGTARDALKSIAAPNSQSSNKFEKCSPKQLTLKVQQQSSAVRRSNNPNSAQQPLKQLKCYTLEKKSPLKSALIQQTQEPIVMLSNQIAAAVSNIGKDSNEEIDQRRLMISIEGEIVRLARAVEKLSSEKWDAGKQPPLSSFDAKQMKLQLANMNSEFDTLKAHPCKACDRKYIPSILQSMQVIGKRIDMILAKEAERELIENSSSHNNNNSKSFENNYEDILHEKLKVADFEKNLRFVEAEKTKMEQNIAKIEKENRQLSLRSFVLESDLKQLSKKVFMPNSAASQIVRLQDAKAFQLQQMRDIFRFFAETKNLEKELMQEIAELEKHSNDGSNNQEQQQQLNLHNSSSVYQLKRGNSSNRESRFEKSASMIMPNKKRSASQRVFSDIFSRNSGKRERSPIPNHAAAEKFNSRSLMNRSETSVRISNRTFDEISKKQTMNRYESTDMIENLLSQRKNIIDDLLEKFN